MRHTNCLLKPVAIDNAKSRDKAHALTDGGGPLLEVLPSGTKTWRFKYHLNGKREKVTIGAGYLQRWPQMAVDVDYSSRRIDLVHEGIDLALRVGAPDDSRLPRAC